MDPRRTEALHDAASGLDARPLAEVARLLAEAQITAATALRAACPAIAAAAADMARTIRTGACLHYAAAGSSGLMAAADAQELGGTFSIPAGQLRIHMAGGLPSGVEMPGATEDDTAGLDAALAGLTSADTLIAVSASGSTPYTLAACSIARRSGATIIAIANNPDAKLFEGADHAICLDTPPEILSGSTRMGAGTAQKIALNMLSTLMAVELGHVHDGMMVNLTADNAKLRARARGIVERIAGVDEARAAGALEAAGARVKPAVLIASGAPDRETAETLLDRHGGRLRPALAQLG
ncbi:N-acetylmuramic acid 6-phosphate etherase [Pseudoponticoccus marisrubri]|uniref:N-acetylmuramic acid 6-phosphate etherase n=1 Tax=Pseudoponticoccus marisrubri TaxID=1685382 RepID=A0A0W7WLA7_9RHOB|nr:N-acetylmuramic acid 6-phosphate etherase [Pseudoponticoccus marisrubri]KUF11353.1 N-acetylmuramic acid 6-phosphate etherase [Pseudoponticoccus marisrubri]